MRILFVIHQFYPEFQSGTEKVTLELARSAQRDGHRVVVLTTSMRELSFWQDEDDLGLRATAYRGLKVVALPRRGDDPLYDLGFDAEPRLGDLVDAFFDRHGPFDLAHVMHSLRMFEVLDAIRARGIAYIVTLTDYLLACHRINLTRVSGQPCEGPSGGRNCSAFCAIAGQGTGDFGRRLARARYLLAGAAHITTCSESVSQAMEHAFPGLRIQLIEHGINLFTFGSVAYGRSPVAERAASGRVTFGFLGTLTPVKGVHVLMRAFMEAGLGGGARLAVVGPCFDPDYLAQLRDLAALDGRIEIRDAVSGDGVPLVLKGFDVLCIPSIVPETYSLAMFEGFASGLPCIVSDLGHPASVVGARGCGEVVAHGDVGQWALGMARFVGRIDEYRSRLPVPCRIEEEGSRYGHLYKASCPT